MAINLGSVQTNTYTSVYFNYDDIDNNTVRLYIIIGAGGGISLTGSNLVSYQIIANGTTVAYSSGVSVVKPSGTEYSLVTVDVNRGGNYRFIVNIPSAGSNYKIQTADVTYGFNYRVTFDFNESPYATKSIQDAGTLTPTSHSGYFPSSGGNLSGTAVVDSWKNSAGDIYAAGAYIEFPKSDTWYAIWKYNLSCNANGGSGGSTQVIKKVSGSSYSLPAAATRTGYTFSSWGGYSPGATISNTASELFKFGTPTNGTRILNAVWVANTYAVSLNQQYGTGGTSSVSATYGSAMPTITIPSRIGYTFQGYYTAANGSGTRYYKSDGTSNAVWNITSSQTVLYAYWTLTPYTITYDKTGGTGGTTSATAYYNQELPTITCPTRVGFLFNGYYSASSDGTKYYDATGTKTVASYSSNANMTLYAQWTPANVVLSDSFTLNGFTYNQTYSTITALGKSAYMTLGVTDGSIDALEAITITAYRSNGTSFIVPANLVSKVGGGIRVLATDDTLDSVKSINVVGKKYNENDPSISQAYYFSVSSNIPQLTTTAPSTQKGILIRTNYVAPNISSVIFNNYTQDSNGNITGFDVNIYFSSICIVPDFGLYKSGTYYKIGTSPNVLIDSTHNFRYISNESKYVFNVSGLSIPQTQTIELVVCYYDFNNSPASKTTSQTFNTPKVDIFKKTVNGLKKVGVGIGSAINEVDKVKIGWSTEIDGKFNISDISTHSTIINPLDISLKTGYYALNGEDTVNPPTNLPDADFVGVISVKVYSATFRCVKAYDCNLKKTYISYYKNGTWDSWKRLALLEDVPSNYTETEKITNTELEEMLI